MAIKPLEDILTDLSDEELLKACELCRKATASDCNECPYNIYGDCIELDSILLKASQEKLINLKSLYSDLKDKNTSLINSLEKFSDDFWLAHNDCLKEIENELYKQIRKYLNSLDTTGLVTQTELNMIIKKVIESGYVKIT